MRLKPMAGLGIVVCVSFASTGLCARVARVAGGDGWVDGNRPRFVAQWDVREATLTCVVNEVRGKPGVALPSRTLSFFRGSAQGSRSLFSYNTTDQPLAIFSTGEAGANFVTVWVGGSALHVIVFHFRDGTVQKVLEVGSRSFPEFVRPGDISEPAIIVSDGYHEPGSDSGAGSWIWGQATVLLWNGESYDAQKADWSKRLQVVPLVRKRGGHS